MCGNKQEIALSERTYCCDCCGFSEDRDIHAAKNMIIIGQELAEYTHVDRNISWLKHEGSNESELSDSCLAFMSGTGSGKLRGL